MNKTVRALCSGTINLGGDPIECFVLETATRVLISKQIQALLGMSSGHARKTTLDRSLARISSDSEPLALTPVIFSLPNGGRAAGYDAEDLVKILWAYQHAFIRGTIHDKQKPMAMAAMAAIEAFSLTGLRALIDEATGYQDIRPKDALNKYYSKIFVENMRIWEEQFDEDWDKSLCRLYGWPYEGRPPMFARNLNAMVYRFTFGNDAYNKLKERNPNPRKNSNHHQLLTDEAKVRLSQTINTVRGVIKLSRNPKDFLYKLSVIYKDVPLQTELFS